jgi:hypothetical protein
MTVATEPTVTAADPQHDIPDVPIYRLSTAQYHAMAKAGILTADDRVELLQGWLVAKMSKNPPHYRHRHPGPRDVALVVEVADTTLRTDRGTKKRAYAHAGIPIYWIANLVDLQFEVYADPSGPVEQPDYGHGREYGPEDTLPVVALGATTAELLDALSCRVRDGWALRGPTRPAHQR